MTKVCGTSNRWWSPYLENCQTRARGNASTSLAIVIIFCDVLYVIGINLYTVAPFILTETHATNMETYAIIASDLSKFLQYSLLQSVVRYRIGSPESEFEYAKGLP